MNYQEWLDQEIKKNQEKNWIPNILLHSCCAPCSSYVISYLSDFFNITILYYNPNISPQKEYLKRKNEQIRLINTLKTKHQVTFLDCDYDNNKYNAQIRGLEHLEEGGERCLVCYHLRLEKTAEMAINGHFDYFATTLTISPLKNATKINDIGSLLEEKYHIKYLLSDFKKREGYKKSIQLSKQYELYRQDYCGCIYSKNRKVSNKIIVGDRNGIY